jgi:signal peptidase I
MMLSRISVSPVVLTRAKRDIILGVVTTLGSILITLALTGCGSTSQSSAAGGVVSTATGLSCVVPSLRGEPLRVARKALRKAHCGLGRVTLLGEPAAFYKEGSSYIVTGQSVSAGTTLPVNSAVAVQLDQAPAGIVSYRVPSGSMEPSFPIGTTVWVQTRGYSPAVGDVVVFHPPSQAAQELCGPVPHTVELGGVACDRSLPHSASVRLIKRIAAGPGDVVSIRAGHIILNGKRENDPYIRQCGASPECNFPTPIKIPAGHWFMMGDNRGESDDSRFWGPVPTSWIIGHVIYCAAVGVGCPGASQSRKS